MIRDVNNLEDAREELMRYFRILWAIPAPKLPRHAKNRLWSLLVSDPTYEDADDMAVKFCPTSEDISNFWRIDAEIIPELTKFEYRLLEARLRERPLPWKVLEYRLKRTRQMLKIYQDKALARCLKRFQGLNHD